MLNDYADKSFLRARPSAMELVAWLAFVAAMFGLLMLWSWTAQRDADMAARERVSREHAAWINRACQPTEPGQRAASEMRQDGSVECAITSRHGMRLVQRMEMTAP